jgi:lipid II:glycine glycyltransferase (peptidoglycan interpeptide bridge formation enzyme)
VTSPRLSVRTLSPDEHRDFLRSRSSVSFLQTPAWAAVKSEWRAESIGWLADGEIVGAALVLYRQLPKLRRYLAYVPEGPVIDWESDDLAAWLTPMTTHLKPQGAFGVRIGPPVVLRRWAAAQVKEGIADPAVRRLTHLPPTERSQTGARVVSQLRELGWRDQSVDEGFAAGQPQFNFQIPLASRRASPSSTTGARTEADVLAGMNQLWRRNIKKAAKAGVEVSVSGFDTPLPGATTTAGEAFHALYAHTAERDHFTPRPLSYFRTMFAAMGDQDAGGLVDIRLYLAHHEGDLVAATIGIRVGTHAWYSYGASSTEKREVRGSNAVQWLMIRDAIAAGAEVYDLRGITETLDADDSHVGLVQFKVGTGGEAVEYAGEWDLPLNRALYKAFDLYMSRR